MPLDMRHIVNKVEAAMGAVSTAFCLIGGWLLISLSFAICLEVILRKVFSMSLQGIDEYGGYALAVTSALGMAFCFYDHAHIRIDLLVRRLPRPLFRASSFIAIVTLGATAWYLASGAWSVTLESWEFGAFANTPLRTPLYIPQGIWATGLTIFFVAIVVRIVRIVLAVTSQNHKALSETLDHQPEDEVVESVRGVE